MSDEAPKTALQLAQERRMKRQADAQRAADEQKAMDLEAIAALEDEHGMSNVVFLEVGHTPGLPVLVAARCPDADLVKRYRKRIGPDGPGPVAAHEEIAASCRIYPRDAETYAKICAARPGVHAELGAVAMRLAAGKQEEQGKG